MLILVLCIKVYGWWIWCNNSELPFNLPNYLGFIFFLIFCQFDGVVDEVFNLELLFYIVNLMLVAIEFLWYIDFLGVIDQCYLEEKILWTIRFLEVFCGVPSGCVLLVDSISQRELFTPGESRQEKNWVCYGLFRVLHQSRISLLFKATLPHWKQSVFHFILFFFNLVFMRYVWKAWSVFWCCFCIGHVFCSKVQTCIFLFDLLWESPK